jgi:16S rRNA (adenine1518-N6/adenine1519-N6)-dimethyltransferase
VNPVNPVNFHASPRKRFGQHFLRDRGVVERIVAAFDPRPGEPIVEIGPGEGVLTRALLARVPHLDAVEIDRDLAAQLTSRFTPEQLTLHNADALDFDFARLARPGGKLRLIGNLPYNISTPLLFHLLDQIGCVSDMLFMLQKEVVERMAAPPGGKDYGRLSVMIQWRLKVEKLFDVAPGSFFPPPKVESSVVRLTPHATAPVTVRDPRRFADIVQASFAHRRKTLRNNLKGMLGEQQMRALGIDPARRAETLTLEEFSALGNAEASA